MLTNSFGKQEEGRVRGPEHVDNLPEALQKAPLSL